MSRAPDDEEQPLLRQRKRKQYYPSINLQHWTSNPLESANVSSSRGRVARLLSSKLGHYSVLLLVSVDVTCIFADFVISLFKCEDRNEGTRWDTALEILGVFSLIISCLFMVELAASIWAFGWQYFRSWFHCFDAVVIIAAFVLDVLLRGILEEAVSLIVVLRLWRVFKIIEELSVGAQEQVEGMEEIIQELKGQIALMRQEIDHMKQRLIELDPQDERHDTPPTPD